MRFILNVFDHCIYLQVFAQVGDGRDDFATAPAGQDVATEQGIHLQAGNGKLLQINNLTMSHAKIVDG